MIKEFKDFAIKGNVMDLAVGVVIGGAFGKIVSSLVNDIIMPLTSILTGGISFSNLKLPLYGETSLNYGQFIQNIIDFLIIAFSIFIFIRLISRISITKRKKEELIEEIKLSTQEKLLIEIRDLLKILTANND